MEECTGIAEVIKVTKHPVVEIAEGVEVGGFTVQTKIRAPAQNLIKNSTKKLISKYTINKMIIVIASKQGACQTKN
jgi:hypothetical protein